ncbi:WD repeat-containing protein 3-like [Clavelina lepadiformis]|uniref:WD repeat-containing protein 3-like n=2 Tax=Clavelina lepadiformis TaxID=159417 RepID=UPI0040415513
MGLTKQYLRYSSSAQFGVIGSTRCNVVFLKLRNTIGRYVASGAVEDINVWDSRTGEKVLVLQGDKFEVTWITACPDGERIAAGYSDGSIKIFNLITGEVTITFTGHRSAISCLAFDENGMLLASGSHDTDVVVWDLVAESGLYRLKGHKGIVTQCCFVKRKNMLITSSKDTYIKWWDLDTQHCFKTMVGHRAEVWAFLFTPDERRLITGSSDSELRVWNVELLGTEDPDIPPPTKETKKNDPDQDNNEDNIVEERQVICTKAGSLFRKGRDRVVSLNMTSDGRHIVCHGNDKMVEFYRLYNESEIEVKLKKKLKKAKKKKKKQEEEGKEVSDEEISIQRTVDDELAFIGSNTCAGKICSLDIVANTPAGDSVVVTLLRNNQIETISATTSAAKPEFTSLKKLCVPGHRSECQSLCFTSDGMAFLTASSETAKLWNRTSQQCVRTVSSAHTKCCAFVPGDRQSLLGTKDGTIEILDVASGVHLESISAHNGGVSSLALQPDQRGIASGGADKFVKFWEFDLISDDNYSTNTKRLSLAHTRSLELDDQVLTIEFSANKKLIAISLLDCSIKVFYVNTLKFFLSLYGHSLPPNTLSISSDSSLIVTGSSDRNVKIWGLDFGDCHRSLFAHDDDVSCVKFVPDTHLFFSCGKDGLIKQWDADKFLLIQVLRGHLGPVWAMSIGSDGDYLATCGRDRSLRLWQRTMEVVIPDEEREMEREEEDEKSFVKNQGTVIAGEVESSEVGMATKTTAESIKATERIMEAIELYREETLKEEEYNATIKTSDNRKPYISKHPILMANGNMSATRWVLKVLRKIKSSELEEALLVLPFSYVPDLLKLLNIFVSRGGEVELVCRCIFFLMRIHHGRITSNQMLVDVIDELRTNTDVKVREVRDTIGFNKAALNHIRRQIEEKNDVKFFSDATQQAKQKKKKRKRTAQRAILTL